jgi:regulator of replication initiation timing
MDNNIGGSNIEKINSIFKSIRDWLSKALDFIVKIKDIIWFVIVLIIVFVLMSQCSSKNKLENEVDILTNNTYALSDSIRNYKDELGNMVAEKHALQLSQDEMEKTIGELKKKNQEYVSYINSNINLKDTIYVEKVVYKDVVIDTTTNTESGTIHLEKNDTFNTSSRQITANIPYTAHYPSNLSVKDAEFILNQNIFVEGIITRNNKTKETMFQLKTDYPGVTFNSGNAIVATNGKQYDRDARKRHGIGISIGPSFGYYYFYPTQSFKPAVGFSITIGYTFTPKAFQW